jgi:uncharacterized membrane protein YphA (DoxX/SURF4 family)
MTDRGTLQALAWAALRIVAGAMFTFHGVQKILGWLASHPPRSARRFGSAG